MSDTDFGATQAQAWLSRPVAEIQSGMERGEVTACDLVAACLSRTARYDQAGPGLNAVLEINPDAWHIAEALDLERKTRGPRGPLHGIPVLVKDNIDTGDRMHTSAGSIALKDSYAAKDAFVAKRLRDAGAVILGKGNMTEWANFMTQGMPSGYSSRGGQVKNPYGPGRFDVGGSSSGSGAAVAADLAVMAVGTETSGSILSPSSQNSLVGIKPTVGLVSRSGIIPISHSQDTAGPMAHTVADAATLLQVLMGRDADDPATWRIPADFPHDLTAHLDAGALRGARIGVPRSGVWDKLPASKQAVMEEAIRALRDAGAQVVDPADIPTVTAPWGLEVLVHEFKPALNAYLGRLAPHVPVHTLADVIAFNLRYADKMLKYGQVWMLEAEKTSGSLTDPAYIRARLRDLRWSRAEGIDRVLSDHGLDALLFPNNLGAGIAAKAGYPSITVPAGYTGEGEPVGATFTGPAFSEPRLIRLAYAFEQFTQARRAPRLDA
ncbi:amidase [Alicyclobacillus sp.]|uniref:amidase n=1 Tax=Alicyclobacillus sp. TaxID=61169 RepID=UPI0025B7ADB6|nr:amidase [Alicyclobacillus sp.]MCL6517412.1 amidase [Alicyclobacillus sp.]